MKKLFVVLIMILVIYFAKDFMLRKYFIDKIEYVDYDNYILEYSYNGKKVDISYVGYNFTYVREYDKNENLKDYIIVYNYGKSIKYKYDLLLRKIVNEEFDDIRLPNLDNRYLLTLLKDRNKFIYKGIENINNRKCYVLLFKTKNETVKIYLDKELLYTVRREMDYGANRYNVFEYVLDLEIKQKDIFDIK